MSLTYSHDTSQRPMYKGLKACEGYSSSLTSPSLFYLRALTLICDRSECDPKCEGNVRDFCSPSRASNALCIRVSGLSCEYVRVKTTVKPNQERQIATRHISNRETTSYCSRNDLSLIEKRRVVCCSWETKNRWFTKLWSTNLCTEKIIRTFAVLCEYW